MKIVINVCYGGCGLSVKAAKYLGIEPHQLDIETDHISLSCYSNDDMEYRTNPKLIQCIEELGSDANGKFANLKIVDIPDNNTDWRINEYDGFESIIYVVDGKIHVA